MNFRLPVGRTVLCPDGMHIELTRDRKLSCVNEFSKNGKSDCFKNSAPRTVPNKGSSWNLGNTYWQIMENSSRNFSEIFIFWVVTKAVLLENLSIFFEISILGRHTDRFTGKLNHSNFLIETIHPTYDIWYVTFGLDEFSNEVACVTPQNSPIDDWMSFPARVNKKNPQKGWRDNCWEMLWISQKFKT